MNSCRSRPPAGDGAFLCSAAFEAVRLPIPGSGCGKWLLLIEHLKFEKQNTVYGKALLFGKTVFFITFTVNSLTPQVVGATWARPCLLASGLPRASVTQNECLFLGRLQGQGSRCLLENLEKELGN